tara:strand:+ start:5049 stop:5666 length:618 start_codon:yes stop_codon:yes gene_type:complete
VGSIVVGIAGGSASGKSTVVRELTSLMGRSRVAVLSHDAYYHDLSHMPIGCRIQVNVDHPDSLETSLLVRHIKELKAGHTVEIPSYDYASQTRSSVGVTITSAPVLIVEGMLALFDERLRDLMDLRVFVDTSPEQRLERRIERDVLERGRDAKTVKRKHLERVQPMHEIYVEPSRVHADYFIPEGGYNIEAIQALADQILGLLDD